MHNFQGSALKRQFTSNWKVTHLQLLNAMLVGTIQLNFNANRVLRGASRRQLTKMYKMYDALLVESRPSVQKTWHVKH